MVMVTLTAIARSLRRWLIIGGAVVAIAAGTTDQAKAQGIEFTPADPANCALEPYTVDELRAILLTASAAATPGAATPETDAADPEASPFALPAGEAADEATVAEIEATMRQILDCTATGDFLSVLAGFSPEAVTELFVGVGAGPGPSEDEVGLIITALTEGDPTPEAAADRSALVGVRDVRTLGNGRVGALVDTGDASELSGAADLAEAVQSGAIETAYVVFANDGERYVIVELVDALEEQYPASG
ncbi:MAG: hypothetical protein AVDCRST_MAG73-3073 [uncultured Thermomicrobiales bacterium]|uniref:Uncharacterized protein n=1 Tax=uncultured Thermomicrobiales bacterium TaxID=1645740 RepID=A0A6J4UJH1_9BACT|nr:MAG: hypothetical protein AVDCRST_MAG73-3073 [uncultured Thermomicrobiales bacterium]